MAGLSSRFFKAGYKKPKYQLQINGESMFSWSVKSFAKYFKEDTFIFVCRDIYDTPNFVNNEINLLGISNSYIVCLEHETRGQAETVYMGLQQYLSSQSDKDNVSDELFIFNIDSKIIDFEKPNFLGSCDGYLEVFEEKGEHWSFVLPGDNNIVRKTTEKDRISNFCSDGLYYFKSVNEYMELFELNLKQNKFVKNELYIAPMYNDLIANGCVIKYNLINRKKVIICGTPKEYTEMIGVAE